MLWKTCHIKFMLKINSTINDIMLYNITLNICWMLFPHIIYTSS